MDTFFMLTENADFPYLSANFTDLETGEKPFDGYTIIETDEAKIGFVGITTPETPTSSRPSYFMNDNGEYIYGFCGGGGGSELYAAVQEAVDGALSDGADYIVVLGHMGDLCADAYRIMAGADIGLINGGGVRSDIAAGDITYGDIINVQPFGNSLCIVEVTGQQILDCLEMGAVYYPEENGAFMQVSGLTYEVHSYLPSSVRKDDDGNFISVDGEYRVKNVLVNGEPLDLAKTYTLASHNYMLLSCGDGMTMFRDCNIIARETMIDNQMLIEYIADDLGGTVGEEYSDPRGSGRITIVSEAPADTQTEAPKSGNTSASVMLAIMAVSAAMAAASRRK